MGSGIAEQIKRMFPEAYEADLSYPYSSEDRFGRCSFGKSVKHKKFIFNLYGQMFYGRAKKKYTNDDKLYSALELMFEEIEKIQQQYPKFEPIIGFPYNMGCDRAGGDWETVEGLIRKASEKYNQDVYIYKYNPPNQK